MAFFVKQAVYVSIGRDAIWGTMCPVYMGNNVFWGTEPIFRLTWGAEVLQMGIIFWRENRK